MVRHIVDVTQDGAFEQITNKIFPPMADETDKCPPHYWKLTTDSDGNEVHQCCKCPARKVVMRDRLDMKKEYREHFRKGIKDIVGGVKGDKGNGN